MVNGREIVVLLVVLAAGFAVPEKNLLIDCRKVVDSPCDRP